MSEAILQGDDVNAKTNTSIPSEEIAMLSSRPSIIVTRNQYGLIGNGSVQYHYTPENLIDWRKMINPKHLAINKFNFEKKSKPIPESIDGLDDKDLLILLPGIKELAQIRGYHSVNYVVTSPAKDYTVATCSIQWIPNFETEDRLITFSAIGDASPENTNSFGKFFLGAIAENRAFVRAVRNFLKINIVSQEEINPNNPLSSSSDKTDPTSEKLATTMAEHGITFGQLKNKLVEEKFLGAENFESVVNIPKVKQLELIARIKNKAKAKNSNTN